MLTSGRQISSARRERPISTPMVTPISAASAKPVRSRITVSRAWCGRIPATVSLTKDAATSSIVGNNRRGNIPAQAMISQITPTTRNGKKLRITTRSRLRTCGRSGTSPTGIVAVTASCIWCLHPPKVRAMSPFDNEPFGSLVTGLDHRIVRFE